MITRPPFLFGQSTTQYNFLGPLAALLSTIFAAIVYILLRALKNLHFSVIMVYFATYSILQTSTMAWATGNLCWPKCGTERLLVIALGLFSFSGQMLLTIAAQLEEAGLVAIARTVDVVFAFMWQIIFFNEIPNIFSILGAVLVTSSVVLIGLRKWMMSMPSTSNIRKKLGFLFLWQPYYFYLLLNNWSWHLCYYNEFTINHHDTDVKYIFKMFNLTKIENIIYK